MTPSVIELLVPLDGEPASTFSAACQDMLVAFGVTGGLWDTEVIHEEGCPAIDSPRGMRDCTCDTVSATLRRIEN